MSPQRILVLGSGGREHALAWRLAADAHAPEIWVAPGNDAMARRFHRLALDANDPAAVVSAARAHAIDLVVVGPEAPLVAGVSDALTRAGVAVFGASAAAAQLEASKWFAKDVMRAAGVPTARASHHASVVSAMAELARTPGPFVVKADGLAAGKGVRVTSDRAEAEAFVRACLEEDRFGAGGQAVVLEEHLAGEEASVIAVCDGERAVLLPPARDYKRAFDGDLGPNTGGMGSYAPTPAVDPAVETRVLEEVVLPVLREMERRGTPFRGALYCGLMLSAVGIRVIEFNARFGDPETQSVLPLLTGNLSLLLASAAAGALRPDAVGRSNRHAVTIALVDEGYPERVMGGGRLDALDALGEAADTMVFHAGTRWQSEGWTVNGGRAAYVTALGDDPGDARSRALSACSRIGGSGWRYRKDIAARFPTASPGRI